MIGGFFFKQISAAGAKVALIAGMVFYVVTTFILKINIHFIHVWGIEFLMNTGIMFLFSYFYPSQKINVMRNVQVVNLTPWKYTKALSALLFAITLIIYIMLGTV